MIDETNMIDETKKNSLIDKIKEYTLIAVSAVAGMIVLIIPIMLLWDWLMPKIFGLPEISIFETLGILALTGIMFRGK